MRTAVKPGYKLTEVGVIPEDWQVGTLGRLGQWHSGGTPRMSNRAFWNGSIPWVSAKDMKTSALHDSQMRVTEGAIGNGTRLAPTDAILLVVRGMILAHTLPVALVKRPMAFNQDLRALTPSGSVQSEFCLYWFQANARKLLGIATESTHGTKRLPTDDLFTTQIALPSLAEQHAIAESLSDTDALVGTLQRLLAKKCELKQAAMQDLLSGRRRLPGFQEKWKARRLGDHVTILRNGTNARADLRVDGLVHYLHYGDIHGWSDAYITPDSLAFLPAAKAESLDRLKDGDLVFADASEDIVGVSKSVEIRGSEGKEMVAGLHTIAVRFDKQILADGFKGYLQHCRPFSDHLRRLAAGTKVLATNRAHIASAELPLPPLAEQTAIASVLSDMNAEIAALERRRDKTKQLKQAMMQELLTGRTRLV